MIAHGCKYGLEDIQAILTMMSSCLPELLAMGIPVKLDGLGIFEPTAEAKKGVTKAEMGSVHCCLEGPDPAFCYKAVFWG